MLVYSQFAPFLFTASITAGALMFAAGNLVISKRTTIGKEFENIIRNSKDTDSLLKTLEKEKNKLSSDYNKIMSVLILDVLLFLVANGLAITFWIENDETFLNYAIWLYYIGLILMFLFILLSLFIWRYPTRDEIIINAFNDKTTEIFKNYQVEQTKIQDELNKSVERLQTLQNEKNKLIEEFVKWNSEESQKALRKTIEDMTPEEREKLESKMFEYFFPEKSEK